MDDQQWRTLLRQYRVIGVIRAESWSLGIALATAIAAGGIRLIEITWTSDRPGSLIEHLRQRLPHCWIGAGTLLTPADMGNAIAAGAQFGFMPHTDPALIALAQSAQMPTIPGALTPTEIVSAWQAGASAVKVFPITAVGGAQYLRQLQGPLGQIPVIPTGGVSQENGAALLNAGAIAVGISSALLPSPLIAAQDWAGLTQRTRQLLHHILTATLDNGTDSDQNLRSLRL